MSSHALKDLSLFPATAEQAVESRKRSAVEWGRGRSIDQYVERDRIMDEHEHAKDGKLTTWWEHLTQDFVEHQLMCLHIAGSLLPELILPLWTSCVLARREYHCDFEKHSPES